MAFPAPAGQTTSQAAADAEISAEIASLCNASAFPALTADQLASLLKKARRADKNGTSVNSPDWIPTYNVNYAVYNGWLLKAGNSANKYDVADADQKVSRSQMFRQCMDMAKEWKKKLSGSVRVLAPQRSSGQVIPVSPIFPRLLPTEQEQETA